MNKHLKSKKGFTLVELCVVMAILAIIVMMITIFMPLLFTKSTQATDRLTVSEEMSLIETTINKFILHYDNTDYRFFYSDDSTVVACSRTYDADGNENTTVTDSNIVGRLKYDAETNTIYAESTIDSNWTYSQELSNITDIEFEESASGESSETFDNKAKLIGCTVTYKLTAKGEDYNVGLIFITHAQGDAHARTIE